MDDKGTTGNNKKPYSTFLKKFPLALGWLLFVWLSITCPSVFEHVFQPNKQKN